jgi:DeoR family glycerol-3-phosphate regulon repressor
MPFKVRATRITGGEPETTMELSERQAEITEMLRQDGYLTVEALASRYGVTTQTIRRDLNTLCDHGLARRRYGGIEKPAATGNVAYRSRRILAQAAKRAIAREVARHIPNNVSVAFSIGTTPEVVAGALIRHDSLRIFTNNLHIAVGACANPGFKVHVAGGAVRNSDCDVLGPGIESLLSSYVFDFGIYGVAGVDEQGTLLDFHEDEVRARQLIHDNSRTTFLVLDDSKFGRIAHVRGGWIGQPTKIFCNRMPPPRILDILEGAGSELVICDEEEAG